MPYFKEYGISVVSVGNQRAHGFPTVSVWESKRNRRVICKARSLEGHSLVPFSDVSSQEVCDVNPDNNGGQRSSCPKRTETRLHQQ